MFARLRHWFITRKSGNAAGRFAEDDPRLAVAVLLLHCAAPDGPRTASERDPVRRVLRDEYRLAPEASDRLLAQAEETGGGDFLRFLDVVKRRFGEAERRRLVQQLRAVADADGAASEFEASLIWRIAGSLDIQIDGAEAGNAGDTAAAHDSGEKAGAAPHGTLNGR